MTASRIIGTLAVVAIAVSLSTHADARPGAYTDYVFEQPGLPSTFDRYDMFVTWESAPIRGAIYPAFNFGFERGGGYMGTQLEGTDHRVLFSIWDDADDSGTAVPGSGCRRFGGEGTGAQCGFRYDWVEGREYRLRVAHAERVAEGDHWRGSITDMATGVETTIGTILLRHTAGLHGYGRLKKDASTFLEYFGGVESCAGQPYARIRWRGPYANATMWEPSAAYVSYRWNCPTHNDQTSPSVPVVVVEGGGTKAPITHPLGTRLWPPCSYGFDLENDRVQVADAACSDPNLRTPATTAGDVPSYATWTYPDGTSVQGTPTAIANGTDVWAVFYKQPGFAGESFCLGPHRFAELHRHPGWNDAVASHRILRGADPCSPPPGCTTQLPALRCGDGIVQPGCGEQCDFGPPDAGGCCDASCRLVPSGSSCEDGDVCTAGDVCDGTGTCSAQSGCGDGVVDAFCGEQCEASSAGHCCDLSQCRADVGRPCEDDDACTSTDVCDASAMCYGTVEPSPACGTGITGRYFDDADPITPRVIRIDPRIDFDWDQDGPDPSMGADLFTARWEGFVQPRYSETYTFYATTDDGVRLWVDGQLLIDRWVPQSPTETSGTITLQAGTRYSIRMDYFENHVGAVAKLAWASPTQEKQIVPQSALFPDTVCSAGVALDGARLDVSRLTSGAGAQRLSLAGEMVLPSPASPPVDLVSSGVRLRIADRSRTMIDVVLPPGAYAGLRGWKTNGSRTAFTYLDRSSAPLGGITQVKIKAGSARSPGRLQVKVKGRGTYPVAAGDLPLDARVALGESDTQCATAFFTSGCVITSNGSKVRCR